MATRRAHGSSGGGKTRKAARGSADFVIAIPSYKRAETLRDKSLTMLADKGVPAHLIEVFVATPEEKEIYAKTLKPGSYGKLIVAEPGMGAVRNFITRHYPVGKKILNIDDDIKDFMQLGGPGEKLVPIRDFMGVMRRAFAMAAEKKFRLFGFYPVANHYFMKNRVTENLRYIIGAAWGIINPGIDQLKVTIDDKEDVQRSVIMYILDGGVLRFENYTPVTAYYKEPGGMQEERTKNRVDKSARAMVEAYPDFCSLNLTKKSGFAEVRLRDKREGDDRVFGPEVLKKYKAPHVTRD